MQAHECKCTTPFATSGMLPPILAMALIRKYQGVDILQKKPKDAPGGVNSALAKFPEFSEVVTGSSP